MERFGDAIDCAEVAVGNLFASPAGIHHPARQMQLLFSCRHPWVLGPSLFAELVELLSLTPSWEVVLSARPPAYGPLARPRRPQQGSLAPPNTFVLLRAEGAQRQGLPPPRGFVGPGE